MGPGWLLCDTCWQQVAGQVEGAVQKQSTHLGMRVHTHQHHLTTLMPCCAGT